MKKTQHRKERGQALILIVFAIIGLIGMTGLAVDGGNAYAERRRAQNAADTTALDAALAKVRGGNLYSEGLARASSNNYVDSNYGVGSSDPNVNVEIYNPPSDGPYAGDAEYIQVKITAIIPTYFGRVLGINTITNQVQAVARGKPSQTFPIAFGNAVVSLSLHECQAVRYQGNADTILTGGGLYVNSDCNANGNQKAFFNNSGANALTTPCLQAVGGITYAPGAIVISPPPASGTCIDSGVSTLPELVYPNPTCTGDATVNGNTMSPGNYPPAGTPGHPDFPPAGVTNLEPGIYCVNDGSNFDVNGGDTLTGDNVVIVVESGSVSINGGGSIDLSAPTDGPYAGLFLFIPESNTSTVSINGNADVEITGTILAPSCLVTIEGNGSTFAMNSQVIGLKVYLSGGATTSINYNDEDNYDAPVPPQVELVQ